MAPFLKTMVEGTKVFEMVSIECRCCAIAFVWTVKGNQIV